MSYGIAVTGRQSPRGAQPVKKKVAMASENPTAQPKSILRGHKAQVHAASFVRGNQRLASGDSEGHVVLWDLTIMRPRAVWRAHTGAILGVASWGTDKIIT